jgi:hypothetical protein
MRRLIPVQKTPSYDPITDTITVTGVRLKDQIAGNFGHVELYYDSITMTSFMGESLLVQPTLCQLLELI